MSAKGGPVSAPLRLDGVEIALGDRVLVPALDLVVGPGECVTVMGPSGCGKSTLLAYLAGTIDPVFRARGRVRVGDDDLTGLPPECRRLGLQFQDDLLFPHLSVGGNLAFALAPHVRERGERRRRIEHALGEPVQT
jgi:putative thiamine transport system ATP-binding protein